MQRSATRLPLLAARLALAAVFLYAGAAKINDPSELAGAIANYRVLPEALVIALAGLLPVTELLVGLALLAGPCVQGAGLVGALMLAGFAAAMAQAKLRGIDLECGCFGAAVEAQVSWNKVALNVVLGALAAWTATVPPVRWRELLTRAARPLAGCAAAGFLLATVSAHASVVLALDLAALVARADEIVVGTAGSQASRWSSQGRLIVTDIQLSVEESMKGVARPGQVLVVTRLGGTIDDLALQVPGEANLAPDQRALVFLEHHGRELRVVGMAQGVLPVEGTGPSAMVLPNAGGMELVTRDGDGSLAPARAAVAQPKPLADLRGAIRRLLPGAAR